MKLSGQPLVWLIIALPLSSVAMGILLLILALTTADPHDQTAAEAPNLSKTSWRADP